MKDNSYRSILKNTAVFGGTQALQMLILILKSKIIAVYLGPYGMGLNSIFQNTVLTVSQLSNVGIFQSSVRELSLCDEENRASLINAFFGLSIITGLLGMIVLVSVSGLLSFLNFGNLEYCYDFIVLSLAMFFYAISSALMSIMQGTRQVVQIAKSSLLNAILGLTVSFILYYYYGVASITWVIVVSYLMTCFSYFFVGYFKTLNLSVIRNISLNKHIKPLLQLGVILMLSGFVMNLFTLLTNSFISKTGSVDDVGYFQAAFSITNRNILIVTSVLASDFFPRLSNALKGGIPEVKTVVNYQLELMVLITAPIICIVIVFSSVIVKLLLSEEFIVIIPLLRFMALALIFRIIWQVFSYIILANGYKKMYFGVDAILGNGLCFIMNILFYIFWGLKGLGLSFVISSVLVSFLLMFFVWRKCKISISLRVVRVISIQVIFCIMCYSCVVGFINTNNEKIGLIGAFVILVASVFISIIILKKRLCR